MEFKRISELEKIDSLPENASLLAEVDGTPKRLAAENAKFGGGGATVFYITENGEEYSLSSLFGDKPVVASDDADAGIATQELSYENLTYQTMSFDAFTWYSDMEMTQQLTANKVAKMCFEAEGPIILKFVYNGEVMAVCRASVRAEAPTSSYKQYQASLTFPSTESGNFVWIWAGIPS